MSLGDWEEGKKKARAGRWEVRHAFTVFIIIIYFFIGIPSGRLYGEESYSDI